MSCTFSLFCIGSGVGCCSLSLSSQTQGLSFASVHDSYWTHPSSIDQMSTIIRDTFIALHSSDVLGRLLSEVTCFRLGKHFAINHLRVSFTIVPRALRGLQSPSRLLEKILTSVETAGYPRHCHRPNISQHQEYRHRDRHGRDSSSKR